MRFDLRPLRPVLLIAFGAFVVVAGFWLVGVFEPAELWLYDHLVNLRASADASDPRIVLVMLNENDISKYDYPLRDSKLAQLIELLERDHPRAVGLDLYRDLPEPRDGSELPQLNAVLARYANVISMFLYDNEAHPFRIKPPTLLAAYPQRIGFNNFAIDYRTVRRGFVYLPQEYGSLPWQVALLYLASEGVGPSSQGESVRLGKTTFPRFSGDEGGYVHAPSAGYQILFDYDGPRHFKSYSVDQVLSGQSAGACRDKIVLVGGNSETAADFFITPLEENRQVPGVLIHAQAVNQYLRAALRGAAPTVGLPMTLGIVTLLLWSLLASGAGYFCRGFWTFAAGLMACLGTMFLLTALLFWHHLWIASAAPAVTILLAAISAKAYNAHLETRHRSALMHLFSRHVSGEVAKSIWEQREQFVEGNRPRAQKLTATVLFTDLKNYSSISEKLAPDDLMQWINECLGALARHVDANGGIINKYIGDSIMAVFGVPAPRTNDEAIRQDAIHAVRCALEMKAEMKRLNVLWEGRGLARVGLRIGIYTGELMAGTVGHEDRLEYTVIGDSVNTASRLESLDKEVTVVEDVDCRILMGEPTFNLVKEHFEVELMGSTQLKGQSRVSPYYRIVGIKKADLART